MLEVRQLFLYFSHYCHDTLVRQQGEKKVKYIANVLKLRWLPAPKKLSPERKVYIWHSYMTTLALELSCYNVNDCSLF